MLLNSKIIFNIISFQSGWIASVMFAASDMPLLAVASALFIIAINILMKMINSRILLVMLIVTLVGSCWDSVLTYHQVLVFDTGLISENIVPVWIVGMWLLFSMTLNISFKWLYGRFFLAMILGSVFGPLAYIAGESLGAVVIPEKLMAVIVMATGWAILMPLSIKLAMSLEHINNEKSRA